MPNIANTEINVSYSLFAVSQLIIL